MCAPSLWTAERTEYFTSAWAGDASAADILVALNAMDGALFTKPDQLHEKARKLHIKRPSRGLPVQRTTIWTQERLEYFTSAWSAGTPTEEIIAALNAMPGEAFASSSQLHDKATRLGVKRPPTVRCVKSSPRRETTLWTVERRDYFIGAWRDGTRSTEILRVLNEMPGDPIRNTKQLSEKARKLYIRRPAAYKPEIVKPPVFPLWTEERRAIFKEMWERGDSPGDIIARLNTLEGRALSNKQQLADHAKRFGIRRPHIIRQLRPPQPKVPKPRPVIVRSRPTEQRAPTSSHKSPIKVPLHVIYRHGFQLWRDGYLAVDKRDDVEAVCKAIRKAEPGHPGFQLITRW